MKIAICISGDLRTFDHNRMKNLIINDNVEIDFFLHTWSNSENKNKILELNPKLHIIENDIIFADTPRNIFKMFYGIMQTIFLKKTYEYMNNFIYDVVIRIRPDLYLADKIDIYSFDFNKLNTIYTPNCIPHIYINDWFALSNSNNMNIYANCFNELSKLNINMQQAIPENILGHYIKINNLEQIEHRLKVSLKRLDDNHDTHCNF